MLLPELLLCYCLCYCGSVCLTACATVLCLSYFCATACVTACATVLLPAVFLCYCPSNPPPRPPPLPSRRHPRILQGASAPRFSARVTCPHPPPHAGRTRSTPAASGPALPWGGVHLDGVLPRHGALGPQARLAHIGWGGQWEVLGWPAGGTGEGGPSM